MTDIFLCNQAGIIEMIVCLKVAAQNSIRAFKQNGPNDAHLIACTMSRRRSSLSMSSRSPSLVHNVQLHLHFAPPFTLLLSTAVVEKHTALLVRLVHPCLSLGESVPIAMENWSVN